MSAKPDPQKLLDTLVNTEDLTPDKVREIVEEAAPPAKPAVDVNRPNIDLDTALNYFRLNRK
ncbi:MAG: hypothetical protein WCF68_04285 [Terriglobales bacterium]